MMIIRKNYEGQLQDLHELVIDIGVKSYNQVDNAVDTLNDDSPDRAREIIEIDQEINLLERRINDDAISLIMKQQPVATDLRVIISSIKIANDLERIADNASNIAEVRKRVRISDEYLLMKLRTMEKLALLMLADVHHASENDDVVLLNEIIMRDSDIDELFRDIINSSKLIDNDPFVSNQANLVAKYLERIGDHICNIAESVYYIKTGTRFEMQEEI
ncbi:phosphate signaling complex protein PhoU [Abyssicoccus albus]|uniref:phosphate signaling complex protein PhoU n=1 Tax=Abyssicoccus albus TaxID=1817405 RepID=UPI00097E1E2B|nr:phosphate signaling complex protein PhoU [Abyssicoccus albus]AQL56083.1 phosphate transport system regulatory protein PhoU [Abyssicoccus albus]